MIRSQVLIILILIIYFLCNYFYFSRIQFGIFDFLSHTLSYQFSDITGYTALPKFLLVRLGYTLLGIGFLYLWNRIWQRPDNKVSGKWNTYMISILFFLPGSIGTFTSCTIVKIKKTGENCTGKLIYTISRKLKPELYRTTSLIVQTANTCPSQVN